MPNSVEDNLNIFNKAKENKWINFNYNEQAQTIEALKGGEIKVVYFLSKSKWTIVKDGRSFRGHPNKFLSWFRRQLF